MNVKYPYTVYLLHEGLKYTCPHNVMIHPERVSKKLIWTSPEIKSLKVQFDDGAPQPNCLQVIDAEFVDGCRRVYVRVVCPVE